MPTIRTLRRLIPVAVITACLGDPVGSGSLTVATDGASLDTLWLGAPGEMLPNPVRVRVTDGAGRPLPGASLTWEVEGKNAELVSPVTETSADGLANARWQLGTDAAEDQRLHVRVRTSRHQSEIIIRARAVPRVVAQLRVSVDTPAVVRLGDSLPIVVTAVDPFGNRFPAPSPYLAVVDTSVATVSGATVIAGPRRGLTQLTVMSDAVSTTVPLRVIQNVVAIVPEAPALRFTSLGAAVPVRYALRDDKGGSVEDTVAVLLLSDTVVARLTATGVESRAPGATTLLISVGSVSAEVAIQVQQRIASLAFRRDTILIDALRDTTTIRIIARDSLGFPINAPAVTVQLRDGQVVTLASERVLEALGPGLTFFTVNDPETGLTASVPVVVRQVVTAIRPSSNRVVFDALGDSTTITATPIDRLGSPVATASLAYSVSDTAIMSLAGGQVRALGPGQATITVREPGTGVTASVQVVVEQVATSLTVASTFGSPVVTLSAGSPFPLVCVARDRNGYTIARDPVLVRSLKGTVTGSGCTDAQVVRSGYDSIVFKAGDVTTQIGVIVATRPDSVGTAGVAQPLTANVPQQFLGEDVANPLILALRPLTEDIFVAYGNPTTNLDRARAIRDWVARTAVSSDPSVHPDNSTSNLTVLPLGTSWSDVNGVLSPAKYDVDRLYWDAYYYEGYAILDRLLGTLDPITGSRADDGLMVHVAGSLYRIRDINSYHYLLCSYQAIIANALWAAAGLQGMRLATLDHDPAAVFIPELGRWVYQDPTFDEEYRLDGLGEPLSPTDLLAISTQGQADRLLPTKLPGPNYDPQVYANSRSYKAAGHSDGMVIIGSQLYNRVVGQRDWIPRYVQVDVPRLASAPSPFSDPLLYQRVTADDAFPTLGVGVGELTVDDSVYVATLFSTLPSHDHFERRLNSGPWEPVPAVDILPVGACKVEYRSVDALGNSSALATLNVWAPRPDDFVRSADPNSIRARTLPCVL